MGTWRRSGLEDHRRAKSSPERHDRTDSLALLTDRFGFSDQSHTNRRFNRAYGGAPGPSAAR